MAEFRNPNQQASGGGSGSPGNSVILYFSLFIVVFFGMQFFRHKNAQPTPKAPAHTTAPSAVPPPSAGGVPASVSGSAAAPDANAIQASTVAPITVENSLYRITFSNQGAEATSWVLKKYPTSDKDKKPLDLVNRQAAAKFGYPLSLWTYDSATRHKLASARYVASTTASTLTAPATLTFTYASGGLVVKKTFTFDDSYVVRAHVTVTDNGAPVTAALAWPSGFGDQQTLPEYADSTFDASQGDKAELTAYKKVSGGGTLHGDYNWAGVSDLYFAAVFLPSHPVDSTFITLHNAVNIPRNLDKPDDGQTTEAPVLGAAEGTVDGALDARLFVGPKTLSALSSVKGTDGGPSLDKLVNFGFTTIIARPLFLILRWLHSHVIGNWGWSILILTLLLSLLTLPTRVSMMRSSLKMQRIQPQMDAVKQRYSKYKATDPKRQEMNQEIFKLQKDNGVNMFGSCLPMLIQWPLLYGFYSMLRNVIELRQAHWLWVPDLSSPDPYHLLPIFFIVSMFLVQWFTPSPGVDPKQQRMMAITMPAVFGFMTWSIGAGLALYWAASNLLGIVTQLVINRTAMGREMRELALRRAAKKQGKVINAKVVSARR